MIFLRNHSRFHKIKKNIYLKSLTGLRPLPPLAVTNLHYFKYFKSKSKGRFSKRDMCF